MAELYLERENVASARAEAIRDAISAVQWKHTVAATHLQDLWSVSETTRLALPVLVDAATSARSRWDEKEIVDATRHLEAFLFQSRAYLDVYMRLCCEVLADRPPPLMSRKEFGVAIARPLPGAEARTQAIKDYFDSSVFVDGGWGALLRGLRDKVAHRDRLRPSADGTEEVLGVRLDWPNIPKMTYDRLAQDFANGTFELLRSTSPQLFNLEWKTGPFDPHSWDAG